LIGTMRPAKQEMPPNLAMMICRIRRERRYGYLNRRAADSSIFSQIGCNHFFNKVPS
jgi:hypothetical protein